MRIEPYDYQEKAINWANGCLNSRGGCILRLDTGLGKTLVGVEVAISMGMETVFLVPTNVMHQWVATLKSQWGDDCDLLELPTMMAETKRRYFNVVSYHCLTYPEFVPMFSDPNILWVVDELANFKSRKIARTQALLKNATNKLGLTATLIENDLMELHTQLDIVRPTFMPYKNFINAHVMFDPYGGVAGYSDADVLQKKIHDARIIYHVTRDESNVDTKAGVEVLDEVVRLRVPDCTFNAQKRLARKLYDNIQKSMHWGNAIEDAESYDDFVCARVRSALYSRNVRRMIGGIRKKLSDPTRLGRFKKRALMRILHSWGRPDAESWFPVIIFCEFVDTVLQLTRLLRCVYGEEAVAAVVGATTMKKRRGIQEAFNTGKLKILVCSSAGSRGVDMPNGAAVINFDLPWTHAAIVQRNRITRVSTTRERQKIITLVLRDTMDDYLYNIIQDKRLLGRFLDVKSKSTIQSRTLSWSAFINSMEEKRNAE